MKPKNRVQLIKYLAEHPHLSFYHPGGMASAPNPKTEDRTFVKMQANRFVFRLPDGRESELDAPAKRLEFYDDHFAVVFGPEWGKLAGKKMTYAYVDQPATTPVSDATAV